jgi:hypothetical protein
VASLIRLSKWPATVGFSSLLYAMYVLMYTLIFPTENFIPLSTHDESAVSIRICLTVDDSEILSIDDLGLASQELDRANTSYGRTGGGSRVFMDASRWTNQEASAVQTAESTRPAAKTNTGVVGNALMCLDIVVKFVDSISHVISPNKLMTPCTSLCCKL